MDKRFDDTLYREWTIRIVPQSYDYAFALYDSKGGLVELHQEITDHHNPSAFVSREAAITHAKTVIDGYGGLNAPS